MATHTFNATDLDTFKRSWPCNGLPDSLNSLRFEFSSNGDLVDIIAKARNGRSLDSAEFDGPAMVALAEDAKALAENPVTPVIFRMDDGQVTAVFPCDVSDSQGRDMGCYAHIGQHSGCSFGWYRETKAATESQYRDLKRELESAPFGYRLRVYKHMQPWHRKRFLDEVSRLARLRA